MELSVDVTPNAGGTVEINGSPQSSYPVSRHFVRDTIIELKAQSAPGYEFVGWSGDLSGSKNPIVIAVNSDKLITAIFSNITHPLVIQVKGHGSTNPVIGTYSYGEGTEVLVTATPDSGWLFDSWSGEVSHPNLPATIVTVTNDKIVTANFSQIMHSLTVEADGNGIISPETGAHSYAQGTEVTITATPDSGWRFDGWSGEVADPELATTTIVINKDKTVTANFSQTRPNASIIGIIAGSVGAGLATYFATRRRKSKPKVPKEG